jgi:hypothetical protein
MLSSNAFLYPLRHIGHNLIFLENKPFLYDFNLKLGDEKE